MADTFITLHGWVGTEVTHRIASGVNVVNFRVASTPRIKRKGQWVDGETTWYSVAAWRGLADNVHESVRKGDAVIVHGRLRSETWKREDGQLSSTLLVDASLVGHDLCRGTSAFVRATRSERQDTDPHDELAELVHRSADENTQLDSWGNPLPAPDGPEEAPGTHPAGEGTAA